MAIVAGLGIAAPAVPPISASPRRRTRKAMTITATAIVTNATFQLRMMLNSNLFRRLGVAFQGLVRRRGFAAGATSLPQMLDERIEDRDEGEGEYGGGEHATEHGRADGLAARGAGPGREHLRHDAEGERERRHEDGAQPQGGGRPRGPH